MRRPGEGLYLPGGRWLSLVIRTPAICQDEVLTHLAAVFDGIDGQLFWLRYADHAGPHLRVRFHGDPAHLNGRVLPTMGDLVDQLIRDRLASGLAVEPYEQEVERYGAAQRRWTRRRRYPMGCRLASVLNRAWIGSIVIQGCRAILLVSPLKGEGTYGAKAFERVERGSISDARLR